MFFLQSKRPFHDNIKSQNFYKGHVIKLKYPNETQLIHYTYDEKE